MSENHFEFATTSSGALMTFHAQPSYLQIAELVRIDLKTGVATPLDDYTPDEAAAKFWEAVTRMWPGLFGGATP